MTQTTAIEKVIKESGGDAESQPLNGSEETPSAKAILDQITFIGDKITEVSRLQIGGLRTLSANHFPIK
jgi:hypothetical protein